MNELDENRVRTVADERTGTDPFVHVVEEAAHKRQTDATHVNGTYLQLNVRSGRAKGR